MIMTSINVFCFVKNITPIDKALPSSIKNVTGKTICKTMEFLILDKIAYSLYLLCLFYNKKLNNYVVILSSMTNLAPFTVFCAYNLP